MKKTILTLIALMLVVVLAAISQTPPARKHQVVLQMNVDNPDSWNQLFANIQNLQQVFGADKIQIEVVALRQGTHPAVRKVTTEDLFPFASQVDSGVAELVRKQEAGWSYIRAGE